MEGGEHFLKVLSPCLIRFGSEGVLKLFKQKDDKGVCRPAPATPVLLNILPNFKQLFDVYYLS